MRTSPEKFDIDVKNWIEEFQEAGIKSGQVRDVFNRAMKMRRESNKISTKPSHFPLAITEIFAAFDLIQDEKRIFDKTHQSCETCIQARINQVPCPYHQINYKIFETSTVSQKDRR